MTVRRGNQQRRSSRRISSTAMLPLAKSPTTHDRSAVSSGEASSRRAAVTPPPLGSVLRRFLYLRTVFINLHPPPAHKIYVQLAGFRFSVFFQCSPWACSNCPYNVIAQIGQNCGLYTRILQRSRKYTLFPTFRRACFFWCFDWY
jgi:hypothetical protein